MSQQNLAELRGVTKVYSRFTLGPIDLTVPAGTIVGLVGENGAGKTTALKILSGVNRPTGGTAALLGSTPADPKARMDLGVVFEDAYFYVTMTAAQIGRTLAGVYGARWDAGYYAELLHRFALDPKQPMKEFSRGMRMKLSLASALAHRPRLLVLDEATAGLDPVVRGELLDLFLEFIQDEDHAILMSSHITDDLEQVADSIAYLHKGRLLFHQNKDDLHEHYGVLRCPPAQLAALDPGIIVHTRKGEYSAETLVTDRAAAAKALPDAVCDTASIDEIMRFYSGRDAQ